MPRMFTLLSKPGKSYHFALNSQTIKLFYKSTGDLYWSVAMSDITPTMELDALSCVVWQYKWSNCYEFSVAKFAQQALVWFYGLLAGKGTFLPWSTLWLCWRVHMLCLSLLLAILLWVLHGQCDSVASPFLSFTNLLSWLTHGLFWGTAYSLPSAARSCTCLGARQALRMLHRGHYKDTFCACKYGSCLPTIPWEPA